MRFVRFAAFIALFAGLIGLSSCPVFRPGQRARVLLPPPPAHWQIAFPGLAFRVSARDGAGEPVVIVAEDWQKPLEIECSRAVNTPILAWPFVPEGRGAVPVGPGLLRPAGGFFPGSLRTFQAEEVVELSWEDGAAALVVDRAAAAGRDMSRFNVPRLCGVLREHGDPWSMDLDAAAQRISEGEFTAWDIHRLPSRDVRVSPGEGTWFLESVFSVPLAADNGEVVLAATAWGSRRLFSLTGSCWHLEVGEGEPLLVPGP
jgi:hypothetical protein